MKLDLTSLQQAVSAMTAILERALDEELMSQLDDVTQNAVRAGVVQHFEFTYELSWKFIQRWIRQNLSADEAEPLTRRELFRTAAQYGLIANPKPWFSYSEARNLTSHTYDEAVAERVFATAALFLDDAHYLLTQLEARNAQSGE